MICFLGDCCAMAAGKDHQQAERLSKALSQILHYRDGPASRKDGIVKLGHAFCELQRLPHQVDPVVAVLQVMSWSARQSKAKHGQPTMPKQLQCKA